MIERLVMYTIFIITGFGLLHLIPYLLAIAIPITMIAFILGRGDQLFHWFSNQLNKLRRPT